MEKQYVKLEDYDITNNKFMYDIETIEWNLKNSFLSLRLLVRNQKLTPYICAKYVVFGGRNENMRIAEKMHGYLLVIFAIYKNILDCMK